MLGRSASAVFGVFAALLATGATAQDATTRFTRDDREMNAAVAEARRTLPRFFDSYRSGRTERHSVKVAIPVAGTDDHEHIWMRLDSHDGETVAGRLTNEPERLPGLRLNSPYRARIDAISDWSYWDGGLRYGNYTTRVILKHIPASEADAIRKTLSPKP
jgi:uncharacterized protein YegJ (DUF2314 family)